VNTWFRNSMGRTIFETLFVIFLVGLLKGVVVLKYHRIAHHAKEAALKSGLSNIRMSISLFKMLNGRYPQSLRERIEKKVMLPARVGSDTYRGTIFLKEKYLMEIAEDKQGNVVDAFDNPFVYDALKGEVRTSTKGYENWQKPDPVKL